MSSLNPFSTANKNAANERVMMYKALLLLCVFVIFGTAMLYRADIKHANGIFLESSRRHNVNMDEGGAESLRSMDAFFKEYLSSADGREHVGVGKFEDSYREKLLRLGYDLKQIESFEDMSAASLVHLFEEATDTIENAMKKSKRDGSGLVVPGMSDWLEEKKREHLENKRKREERERRSSSEGDDDEDDDAKMERAREENRRDEEEMEKRSGDGGKMMTGEEVMAAIEAHDIAWKKAHPPPSPPYGKSSSISNNQASSSKKSSTVWTAGNLFGHFGSKQQASSTNKKVVVTEDEEDGDDDDNNNSGSNDDKDSNNSGDNDDNDNISSSAGATINLRDFKTTEERKAFLKSNEFKKLAVDLTPPKFCYQAVNGEKAFPTDGKVTKGAPSVAAALKIAEQLTDARDCWFMDKTCVDAVSPGNGKQWIRKYMSAETTVTDILEDLPDFGKGQLGTCALIGSADNMLKKGWGNQIDAHDFVVRFNSKMKGFEKDIGFKTDGLWQKDSYVGAIGGTQKPAKYYMIPKIIPKNFKRVDGARVVGYSVALPAWRKAITEIYKIYKKDKKITKGTPTGGLARMISLMESGACTRVDIYGFSGGGGKYFKKSAVVKDEHIISVEHYIRRLMMATGLRGKVCVYGQ
jgi:hypothetical protein